MEDTVRVGVGFRPYEEELVGFFLRHQNEGNTHLVKDFISEVNICSFDPQNLRLQSKIRSRDQFSYFFSRRENKYATGGGNQQSRTTPSGKWKITGVPSDVKDQWGICSGVRGVIGFKRVLSFQQKNSKKGTKSDWVIHEFHNTLLPESQRNYVICRLEYKGNDKNIILGYPTDPMTNSPGSVVDQPGQGNAGYFNTVPEVDSANQQAHWWFTSDFDIQQSVQPNSGYFNNFPGLDSVNQAMWLSDNSNLQQQGTYSASYQDESQMLWKSVVEENLEFLVDERTYMEENFNIHRPKSPVRGVLAGYSSDSDAESMICGDTSSSTDSVGSSSGSWHTPRDDNLSLTTLEQSIGGEYINYEAQDQPKQQKLQLQGKEEVVNLQKTEREWKMAEDFIKRAPLAITVRQSWIVLEEISQRNSKWNYLKNMIIGILLLISIAGWIILLG